MTTQSTALSEVEMSAWVALVNQAVGNAISGLSEMLGKEMGANALKSGRIPAKEVTNLVGGPETLMVGVYIGFEGHATGHMILAYEPQIAYEFIDMLLEQFPGQTQDLGDMEKSALQEMGNLMGGFFLNTIADANGLNLYPTPPLTMVDKAGVIFSAAMSSAMREDPVLVVDAAFGTSDRQIEGQFLIVPSPHLIGVLRQCWRT